MYGVLQTRLWHIEQKQISNNSLSVEFNTPPVEEPIVSFMCIHALYICVSILGCSLFIKKRKKERRKNLLKDIVKTKRLLLHETVVSSRQNINIVLIFFYDKCSTLLKTLLKTELPF